MADMTKLTAGLIDIVGKSNVVTDQTLLADFVGTYKGFAKPALPIGMVYAKTTDEIKAIIDFVREEIGCGIVTCSSEGTEKLTAASLPAAGTEAIILNLSKMKRIFRIDTRNRVAFVEAGVTFAELEDALKGTGLKLDYPFMARPDKSVVATLLDRDPITAPLNVWDVNDPMLCLEVVFGNGTIFRTGSAAGPGTLEEQWAAGVAMNNSLGPAHTDFARVLSGSQGTLGVVAWASIKLEFELSVEKMVYAQGDAVEPLAPIAWQGIRRRLGNNYVFLNNFALGCAVGNDKTEIDAIASKAAKWTLAINMAGKRIRPEQKVEYQTRDLVALAKGHPIRQKIVDSIPAVSNLQMKKALTGLNAGKLWKLRYSGNAIDIFFLTTLDKVDKYVEVATAVAADKKMAVYVQPCMQGRNCHVELVVPYAEGEKTAAEAMYVALMEALLAEGAFFSRPYGICTDKIFEKAPMQVKTIEKLKKMFDDKHILNPNRFYEEVAK